MKTIKVEMWVLQVLLSLPNQTKEFTWQEFRWEFADRGTADQVMDQLVQSLDAYLRRYPDITNISSTKNASGYWYTYRDYLGIKRTCTFDVLYHCMETKLLQPGDTLPTLSSLLDLRAYQ